MQVQSPDVLALWASKVGSLAAEYLFFVGATYLSLMLLQRRRRVGGLLCFSLGLAWLLFHLPVSLYLDSLGIDSFAETRHVDLHEAWFWLQTMGGAIEPVFSGRKFIVYLLASWVSFHALRRGLAITRLPARVRVLAKLSVAVTLMAVAVHMTASNALATYLGNSELFLTAAKNFDNPAPEILHGRNRTHLVVYIGESTSVMNMGLYGYPRDTTPRLAERARTDPNLIVFHHVFSTHTHTTGSLLEALSLGLQRGQEFLPIHLRRRLSVVDVLHQAGFDTVLLSNQGLDGAWSQASSVIFRRAHKVFRVMRQDMEQPASSQLPRWDDEFFAQEIDRLDLQRARERPLALFLHSYAGHGRYEANIPERFRVKVDNRLAPLAQHQVLDDPTLSVDTLEHYDAAIRYVDYSVDRIIRRVEQSPQPIILVYFSDHGDAAFAQRGHDSARFKHEMARVPLLVYFNDAARREQPATHARYQALARSQATATLAQLATTLMDLVQLQPQPSAGSEPLLTPLPGEKTQLPPILVRQTPEGTSFVNLNGFALQPTASASGARIIDRTDADTRAFVALQAQRRQRQESCRNAGTSFEALSRSILLAGCTHASGAL